MKRNRKNAFTIVEIVIVVAVIAILAAVLIPTFAHIIKKANQSVDEQLVNNLNKILTAEEALEGKNLFMHDAVLDLADNGYDLDALKMNDSDNILVWDQRYDRFIIVKMEINTYNNKLMPAFVYCSKADKDNYYYYSEEGYEGYELGTSAMYWKIYTSADYVTFSDNQVALPGETACFSIYWGETGAPKINSNGTFEVGLDLGYYDEMIETNSQSGNPAYFAFKKAGIRVRGNIGHVQINNLGICHIGKTDKLTLVFTNVTSYSGEKDYYEYGQVGSVELSSSYTTLGNYKLIAESGSQFGQTESEIQTAVGGAQYFENKGGTFDVAALKSTTTEG